MHYPPATSYLILIFEEFVTGKLSKGLSAQILEKSDLIRGVSYITVPLEWPERVLLKSIDLRQFYYETQKSRLGDKLYVGEYALGAEIIKKHFSLLQTGEYVIAFEGGAVDADVPLKFQGGPGQFKKPILIGETWYMLCDKNTTWEDFEGAWCEWDYRYELWYVAKLATIPEDPGDTFLAEVAKNLSHIVCGIYDGLGYMIWYPTKA